MSPAAQSGIAKTRDGISIHYTLHGSPHPGRPRLALIHSLGMSGQVWTDVVRNLADQAYVLTYDCRGHGASTKASEPYRLEMFGDDLADLLTQIGWERAHVAGASLGGSVALQFAALHPQKLQSLGLIDTTAWYGADAAEKWEWRAKEAEEKGLPALSNFQTTRWFSDAFREAGGEPVERCRNIFLANETHCFASTCRMLGAFDLRHTLAAIRVPTAIVVGEQDYATPPEMARQLEAGIAGATLQIIPQARHLTFVEKPEVIAQMLARLIGA